MSKLQVRNVLNWHKLQVLLFFFVAELSSLCQAGSVSGQVVEMGFHSTQLLNSDKFPIVVPNSYFSNQVINLYTTYCLLGDAGFGHLMVICISQVVCKILKLEGKMLLAPVSLTY
jgi:small-conductance mechanosensitive channel